MTFRTLCEVKETVYWSVRNSACCCYCSVTQLCPIFETPWTAACQASLSFTLSQSLLKLMSSELMMPSDHFILCHRLLLLPSISPSIRVFSNELALHITSPKYWSFSFSISPSNEYLGLISLRIDWFDFLAAQGTLKSLLQHHKSKASVLWCSAFFMVQLSHLYMTTGKTIALGSCLYPQMRGVVLKRKKREQKPTNQTNKNRREEK